MQPKQSLLGHKERKSMFVFLDVNCRYSGIPKNLKSEVINSVASKSPVHV